MIVYRINIDIGYRSVVLEFETIEEAGEFAKSFLTHIKSAEARYKTSVSLDVVNTDNELEYADTDSVVEDKEDE